MVTSDQVCGRERRTGADLDKPWHSRTRPELSDTKQAVNRDRRGRTGASGGQRRPDGDGVISGVGR